MRNGLRFSLVKACLMWGFFIFFCPQLNWANCQGSADGDFLSRFAIKEELIYFQPIFNNDFIATPNVDGQTSFTLQPGGPGKRNKFDYEPGYRLSLLYFNPNPCSFIEGGSLRFTYLSAHHFRKISLNSFLASLPILPTNNVPNVPGFLTSDHSLNYYAADLSVSIPVFEICEFSFSVQPGLHYAFMSYRSHVHIFARHRARLKEKSETWGVGPQLGLTQNYQFYDWLALKGEVKGGLLLSKATAHSHLDPWQLSEQSSSSDEVRGPKDLWKVFPFWETNLSLCATFLVYEYPLEVEIGYEYLSYPNFIDRVQFPNNGSSRSAGNAFSNFDFQGPYASLTLVF